MLRTGAWSSARLPFAIAAAAAIAPLAAGCGVEPADDVDSVSSAIDYRAGTVECRLYGTQEDIDRPDAVKLPHEDTFSFRLVYADAPVQPSHDLSDHLFDVYDMTYAYTQDPSSPHPLKPDFGGMIEKLSEVDSYSVGSSVEYRRGFGGFRWPRPKFRATFDATDTRRLLEHLSGMTFKADEVLPTLGDVAEEGTGCKQSHLPPSQRRGLSFHVCMSCTDAD